MRKRPLTVPEALVASAVSVAALVIALAYLWGRVAVISPFAVLGFAAGVAVVVAVALTGRATSDTAALAAAIAIVALICGWLLWLARPAFLPPGGGGDLAHHLQLVDYLERHWRLPDASLTGVMGEMAHYTPGLHLLAALAGAWFRTDGLHTIYPLVAFSVGLKAALVFLIALRVLPDTRARLPWALTSVVLLLVPHAYFVGSFVHDSFLAQVLAELFAVAMWWALVLWDDEPARLPLVLFAAAGVGAFLTWPLWIGPAMVALAVTIVTRDDMRAGARIRALSIACAPIAAVAALHAAGRIEWTSMAGAAGAVLTPSPSGFGWPLLILGATGLLTAIVARDARTTVLLTLSITAQAATLYALARGRGLATPYMAWKMAYLLIYPLAVLGSLALATAWRWLEDRGTGVPRYSAAIVWALLLVTVIAYRTPLTTVSHPPPIVSEDLYLAGRWARAQVESACVDYLVPHADTMYWLHLSVLGNPRASLRTADPDTFVPARAVARWIQPGGLPYAIAHLTSVPREVLDEVDVLEQFGTAAVVKRRGPAFCPDAERLARAYFVTP